MPSGDLAVAVDIGGTFTDVTLLDRASGQSWRAKTPSTPADPSRAFMAGVALAAAGAGAAASAIDRVLHGTTVATNLILEGKTARTALVTTAGFRHVLEIGRQDIPRHANLFAWVKPARPVPPERVLQDVRDGFVSVAAARHDYGVAITGDAVDLAATRSLRAPRPAGKAFHRKGYVDAIG